MRIARKAMAAAGIGLTATLILAGCGGGDQNAEGSTTGDGGTNGGDAGNVTLTWGGWDLDRVPEFRAMAEAFSDANPGITVNVVDYPNAEWSTAMTADLAAGTAPDIVTLRTLTDFNVWAEGGQLRDISSIAETLDPGTQSLDAYEFDGATMGLPFRQDHWVLFYNKDLFTQAGVDFPDGTWTWDDYLDAARELKAGLPDGVFPTYQHVWGDSTVSGFAAVQTPGADLLSGDFSFLAPYYERALVMDQEGLQPSFGAVTTGSLHHLGEFGQQRVAMVPMGTWFMSQLVDDANDVADFEWGVAPAPQRDSSTLDHPISQASPTGVGINASVSDDKVEAAEAFVAFLAGEGGAQALAGLGLVPPFTNDAVLDTMFSADGMPTDELSREAISNVDGRNFITVDPNTAVAVQILNDFHSEVMSGSISVDDGIAQANDRFSREATN